ncbi:hypothetical protein [Kitasatospora sp. A2-31]|uniref:hypothetical protein n=1 Tax=Kitasatospora sp. A2-31 TaxID=2916414 RepID=UPI001EEB57E5|nr:hypothetical protein [Kitasatospora sp. A2-31]MCG6494902.1 hypothetical protein [Kitasatospora sp. A2-31]
MTTTATPGTQINAAGALMAILTAHFDLPTPTIGLEEMRAPGRSWMWGLRIALHDGLDQFEQWRAALDLDPAGVDHKRRGTLAWLTVTEECYGVPVELVGFYSVPAGEEELS